MYFMKKILIPIFLLFCISTVSSQCNVCIGYRKVTRTEPCSYCQAVGYFSETITKDCSNCFGKGYTTHQCLTCNAKGEVPDMKSCPTCEGSGYTLSPRQCSDCYGYGGRFSENYFGERNWVICSKCKGQKNIQIKITCQACKGAKLIPSTKKCPTCHGSKSSQRKCHTCHDGKVSETRTRTCNKCNGTREIQREIPCPICKDLR